MAERVEVPLEKAYRLLNFTPVVIVTTTDGTTANAATVAWCAPCSMDPPMVMACIDSGHKTMENIRKTGAFGLNIPTVRELDLVRYCGSVSGHEGDKLGPRGIRTFQGTAIAELPLLDACAGWLECRPVEVAGASTHDIVVARVLGASARTGALRGDWSWNAQQFPVVHHLGGKRFIVSQEQA